MGYSPLCCCQNNIRFVAKTDKGQTMICEDLHLIKKAIYYLLLIITRILYSYNEFYLILTKLDIDFHITYHPGTNFNLMLLSSISLVETEHLFFLQTN